MKNHQLVLILDFGSQYTQLIARRVRELGVYSKIVASDIDLARFEKESPSVVILSGGPHSVFDPGAPKLTDGALEWLMQRKIPVLGVCYGLQYLMHVLGGKVEKSTHREYGRMSIEMTDSKLFTGVKDKKLKVWMSHGDETKLLPQGFKLIATSSQGSVAAVEHESLGLYGVQFHPEVTHTEQGVELLEGFLKKVCALRGDWLMSSVIDEQIEKIKASVPNDAKVLCALSGGVDSTVAATLVHQAIGDRLHCVFVDHGMLRFEERQRVMKLFEEDLHLPVTCVRAEDRFLARLQGVTDPEEKRKIIGEEFIRVFEEQGQGFDYLVQGTLYPDVVESSSVKGASVTIKTHHNVGGLPKDFKFKLIEPFRELFKDEVRKVGQQLGVPSRFLKRHPFPGPGLAVRIMGEITRERIRIVQEVDEIFIQALLEHGLYDEIWQAFAVFLPIRSVGVQGDGRTHDYVVSLRAVISHDGMTADWYPFEHEFLAHVSNQISNKVKGVNRVVYDISSKPPATIEWE